jgi:hypothetical protein
MNGKCDFVAKSKKTKAFKTRTEIRVERFIIDEIDRYIKLHKEHEKELKYIG